MQKSAVNYLSISDILCKCEQISEYEANNSCFAGKVGQIQDEPSVPLLQPDQARRPGEKCQNYFDHDDSGDDVSKLLWSCR